MAPRLVLHVKHLLLPLLLGAAATTPSYAQKVTESLDTASRALINAGLLSRRGRHEEADIEYQRAIRAGPRLLRAYERYSLFLYTRGKFARGAAILQLGLRLNKNAPTLEAYLGLHLFRLGRIRRSYKLLKRTTAVHGGRFEIHAALAQCAMLMEDYPTVLKAVRRYLDMRPAELALKDHAFEVVYSLALLRTGKRKQAARQLRRVLRRRPTYVPGWLARAELLLQAGKCDKAIAAFKDLRPWVRKSDREPAVARAYLCLKRYREAFKTADRFLRETGVPERRPRPTTVNDFRKAAAVRRALMARGDAALRLGDHDSALADFRALHSRFPGSHGVILRLAGVYFEKARYAESIETLAREVGSAARVLTLRAAVRAKRRSVALKAADDLTRGGGSAKHLYYAGMAHSSFGLFAEAVPLLASALKVDPNHKWARKELVRARCYLSRRALRKGDTAEALMHLHRARKSGPAPEVEHNIALIHLEKGEHGLALRHARAALAGVPADAQVNRVAARALSALGKHGLALAHYRRALSTVKPDTALGFSLRAEQAVASIEQGQVSVGIALLEDLSRQGSDQARLLAQRNLTRALARRMASGQGATLATLNRVIQRSELLPEAERRVVRGLAIIAMARSGRSAAARRLVATHWPDLKLAVASPFEKVGRRLMLAYVDYHSPYLRSQRSAAAELEALARRVPSPADVGLRELASSAHGLLAYQHYQHRRLKEARQALRAAARLSHRVAYDRLHNIAVLDYYQQRRSKDALERLKVLSARVPLAQCNIGVHYHEAGQVYASFQHFNQCHQRGVQFPGLKTMLALKRQLFEGRGAP
jgi:tetratricopeptide (TPR) repeat protein